MSNTSNFLFFFLQKLHFDLFFFILYYSALYYFCFQSAAAVKKTEANKEMLLGQNTIKPPTENANGIS